MSQPRFRSSARRPLNIPRGSVSSRPVITRGPVKRAPVVSEPRVIPLSDVLLAAVGMIGVLGTIAGALVFLMVIAGAGQ